MKQLSEPQDLTKYGYGPGYSIYRDGRIYSTRMRGPAGFKNLDYTGCTLLRTTDGKYVRRSAKILTFTIYVIPELIQSGFVPIYDGTAYINKDGIAYSASTGEKLTWVPNREYFSMHIGNKDRPVHRLVAEAFIPNPLNLPEVDHIDGNKANNSVSNLRWCTRSQNMKYAFAAGALDESLTKAFAAKGLKFNPRKSRDVS